MAKRATLAGNIIKKPSAEAKKGADVAKAIARQAASTPPVAAPSDEVEYETVSYNLPLHLIDLYRDLAAERHRIDQAAKRELRRQIKAARRAGQPAPTDPPPQARQSASAIVREAMEAYAAQVAKELDELKVDK